MAGRPEDYEVLNIIGTGSYGKCCKVRRKADGKILVWKELYYGSMSVAEKQRVVLEVNVLNELRHPNIVEYYGRIIDRSRATLYILMEYCEGGDLASLIAKHRKERCYMKESFVLKVLTQLTLALKECHRRSDGGVTVHRDLKPANVFLDGKQNVKLGDFGLARTLHHDTSFAKTFVGTPYYMSPEQMNHKSYNEKADIWSLGCLLYELCALSPLKLVKESKKISFRRPFKAYNHERLVERIREGKFRRIPYRYSDQLNELIKEMLNVKDYCRPSVEDILQHPLIAALVTEEQRKNSDKRGQRSWNAKRLQHSDAAVNELKWKEQLLEREQAIRERERRLEQREQQLCVRERLVEEKLARAENLMKNYYLCKQLKVLNSAVDQDNTLLRCFCTAQKKPCCARSEEKIVPPVNLMNSPLSKGKYVHLRNALCTADQALSELEENYQQISRQILGVC